MKKNFKNIDYQSKLKAKHYKQKRKAIMLQPYLKQKQRLHSLKPIAQKFLKHSIREALCDLFEFRFEKNRLITTNEYSVSVTKQ